MNTRKNTILALLFLLLTGLPGWSQTIVDVHGQLQVDGTKLEDECGRVTQLKGMSYFWHQWERTTEYVNQDVIQWLTNDWNIELIRIPVAVRSGDACTVLGTSTLTAGQCGSNPGGITGKTWGYNTARTAIRAAISAGIYIIVDWHAHPNELAAAKEFFRTMSAEFGNSPNVIYEIWNEPIGDYGAGQATWNEIKAYSREVIAEIRANDPDNIIVVGTPFYDQFVDIAADSPLTTDSQGNPVSNIMYSFHIYSGMHGQSLRDRANYAISQGLPLFMSEMGRNQNANGVIDEAEWQRWLTWIDENDISFAKWSLSIKNEVYSSLQPSASTSGNWNYNNDLRPEGRWNRDYFRSVNSKATVCNEGGEPQPGTGNVTVRARGTTGSEQIEIQYQNQRVGNPITLSTSFQEYRVPVNNPNGNFKVVFINDNGPRDAEIDWLQVGTTRRQAETRSINTAVWQNNSCGGSNSSLMNCNGYIDFGTFSNPGGNAPIGQTIWLRSLRSDRYVTANLDQAGSPLTASWATSVQDWERFEVVSAQQGRVALRSVANSRYVAVENNRADKLLRANRTVVGGWEQYEWVSNSDGTVSLRALVNGRYVRVTASGAVVATSSGVTAETKFSWGTSSTARTGAMADKEQVVPVGAWQEPFRVYPNPAAERLTIEAVGREAYQVMMYDLSGRKVLARDALQGSSALDVSDLRPGVYLLKLRDDKQHELRQRILIE